MFIRHVFKEQWFAQFHANKTVWDSEINSTILYGCETWLGASMLSVKRLYMSSLKQLLGVRNTTSNELALAESGLSDLESMVHEKLDLIVQKLKSQADFSDSYFDNFFQLANQVKYTLVVQLQTFFNTSVWSANFSGKEKCIRVQKIFNSDNARSMTYSILNSSILPCPIYCSHSVVPEFSRLAVTRLRLSSHYLRIETGRWSWLPRENRRCACGHSCIVRQRSMSY